MLPGREQGEGDLNCQTQPQTLQKDLALHPKPAWSQCQEFACTQHRFVTSTHLRQWEQNPAPLPRSCCGAVTNSCSRVGITPGR